MARQTFSWYPDIASQQDCEPRVTVTKFGDGYEQRVASGMNFMPMQWNLTFDRSRTEGMAILNFLRARGGVSSFAWTNPFEEAGVYVCRKWSSTQNAGTMIVTCTFDQVFEGEA